MDISKKMQVVISNLEESNIKNKMITPINFSKDSPYYKPKKSDEKDYLVYYYAYDDNGDEYKSFELITGRKNVYNFLKSIIEYINLDESRVLVENVKLEDSVSVYDFLVYAKGFYSEEDGFDIDEYLNDRCAEQSEDDYQEDSTDFHINLPTNNNIDEAYDLYLKTINDIEINKNDYESDDLSKDDDIFV